MFFSVSNNEVQCKISQSCRKLDFNGWYGKLNTPKYIHVLSFWGLKAAISLAQADGAFHCTPLQQKDKTDTYVFGAVYNKVHHAKNMCNGIVHSEVIIQFWEFIPIKHEKYEDRRHWHHWTLSLGLKKIMFLAFRLLTLLYHFIQIQYLQVNC